MLRERRKVFSLGSSAMSMVLTESCRVPPVRNAVALLSPMVGVKETVAAGMAAVGRAALIGPVGAPCALGTGAEFGASATLGALYAACPAPGGIGGRKPALIGTVGAKGPGATAEGAPTGTAVTGAVGGVKADGTAGGRGTPGSGGGTAPAGGGIGGGTAPGA